MPVRAALRRALDQVYDTYRTTLSPIARIGDISISIDRRLSLPMRQTLYRTDYEAPEMRILARTLDATDRVLELGSGLGLLSIYCAFKVGGANVATYEGNPEMEPIIRNNYQLNGVNPRLTMAMVGPRSGQAKFHIRKNFWASSAHEARAEGARTVTVPVRALDNEIASFRPTYLIVDIEGGESNLFESTTLVGVRRVLIETHPDVIGVDGVDRVLGRLKAIGFTLHGDPREQRELYLTRD
jgi:FkbM family methyltransferase